MRLMAAASISSPEHPPELVIYRAAHVRQDLALLRKGAGHLRILAWLLFIPASFGGFLAFLMMLMNANPANTMFFVLMLVILIIASFYFSVSSYIRRARRWAVYVALLVAIVPIVISLPFILRPQIGFHRRSPGTVMIEMMYLISHLNMIKDLLYCLGAVDRISWAASLRFARKYEMKKEALEKG
jgi:hypothetical protein